MCLNTESSLKEPRVRPYCKLCYDSSSLTRDSKAMQVKVRTELSVMDRTVLYKIARGLIIRKVEVVFLS